jgi:colicin import membrane protein
MTGFAREHLRPLMGSAGLHLLLIALIGSTALRWTTAQPPVQLAIEGVVVDARDLPKSVRSGKALRVPRPDPVKQAQPPPAPVPDEEARERAAADAAAKKETEARMAAERSRVEHERTEQERARKDAAAAERRKQDQLEAQQQKRAADEARRKAEAEQKKAAAEQARQQKDAQVKAAQDAKAKAALEADLKRRLAAEEEEAAAVARSGVKDEYRALLVQAIERNWIRPPSARAGLACTLYVNQATGGTVIDVKLGPCNGDEAVRESIVNAVYRASPLPAPGDPRAFERRLEIVFRPTE